MTQVLNIPVDLIDTAPQVRTRFNESSIAELAADIKAHGVLQPLVVQQKGERFTLLIGERRLRAIRYLGETMAPAIVGTVAESVADEVQLMENIQREDLSTGDLANAVEKLFKKHKSVSAVAKRINKSPSWVSKRLALAMNVGPLAARLIEHNVKDVELLYQFNKLEKADKPAAAMIIGDVLTGDAGRKEIAAALAGQIEAKKEPEKDTRTADLFSQEKTNQETTETTEQQALKEQLKIAIEALNKITAQAKTLSPLQKWETARDIATATIKQLTG